MPRGYQSSRLLGPGGIGMLHLMEPGRCCWTFMMMLGWMLAAWPASAVAQEKSPSAPAITDPIWAVSPSSDARQDLLDRLRTIEQRLDQLTKQNENLSRENKALEAQMHDLRRQTSSPSQQGGMTVAKSGTGSSGVTGARGDG